ncbi:MAG: 50S ribosomal protein L6 [Bacilli bacterium]
MSRIGNRVLPIPDGVTVTVDGSMIKVSGPKGKLSTLINENITAVVKDNEISFARKNDTFKNFHGTANALVANMIKGVTDGFEKKLEAVGVGYRFQLKDNKLTILAGYSHPVIIEIPSEITVTVPANNELVINGIDKCVVGEFAANIRKIRKPEPYKGKGIRYSDEIVRRKEGKKAS